MATHNVTINLVYGTSFPQIGSTLSVAVNDTVNMTVNMTGIMNEGPRVSESGGFPVLGENKASGHTFSYIVPYANSGIAYNLEFYFYGSKSNTGSDGYYYTAAQRMWGTTNRREGKQIIAVTAYSCASSTPNGTIGVTFDNSSFAAYTNATISGVTAASTGCTLRARVKTTSGSYGNWTTGGSLSGGPLVGLRGSNNVFQVGHIPVGYGAGETQGILTSSNFFAPYTTADLDISATSPVTTTDGTFTVQLSGINQTSNTNKYMLKNSDGSVIYMSNGNLVTSAVGGTSIASNVAANGPASGSSKTYNVWGKRSQSAGGGAGVARYLQTTASVTVTRAATLNEVITETSGSYFDRRAFGSATDASHFLNVTSLSTAHWYNVSKVAGNVNAPLMSGWTKPGSSSATFTVTDAPAVPTGTGGTTVTYYLWRSSASNGASPTATGDSYTRTLVVDDRFSFGTTAVSLASGGPTSFTQTINNTLVGHIYVIRRAGTPLATVTATGTTTSVNISETTIPNNTNATVHTLHTQAPFNAAFAYDTQKSYTVTRAGSAPAGTFGLQVFATNGTTKLYDTDSRTGRLLSFATTPSINAGATATISVPSLPSNTADIYIVIIPQGTSTITAMLADHDYVVTPSGSGGSFTLKNESGIAQAYTYYILRTGGT